MKQVIRLTESDLQNIIEESVRRVMTENEEDESWLGDKFRQGARAAQSFMGRGSDGSSMANAGETQPTYNLRGRMNAAKNGWKEQGRMNGNNNNLEVLEDLAKRFGPDMSLGKLINKLRMSNLGASGRISQAAGKIYNSPAGF
nr:MAG TPA: hypothetical protein [Caudoviricetes sp.]